jgi:hypothetical protein
VTETFQVGDKVTHRSKGDAEVVYGSFEHELLPARPCYLIRLAHGKHTMTDGDRLTLRPSFAIGDEVKYEYGSGGKLVAGPFKWGYHGEVIWVVEKADGTHMTPRANSLTKVTPADEEIKVGDRVRVLVDDANYADVKAGDVFTVAELVTYTDDGLRTTSIPGRRDGWFFSLTNVEKVTESANTYTRYGVTYDLAAKYRDKDGDVWRLKVIDGVAYVGDAYDDYEVTEDCMTLESAAYRWGPLTRVND